MQHFVRRALAAACLVTASIALAPSRLPALAQSYVPDYLPMNIIHDFGANEPGGPTAGLIFDKAGNLYGTEANGNGAVFELSPPPAGSPAKGWKETVLYNFTGGTDGLSPRGSLLMDAAGNLFGTTIQGGSTTCENDKGCGVVFELSPPVKAGRAWTETVLYQFTGGLDGEYPLSALIADSAGNIYGTTPEGGTSGSGTVFELSPPSPDQTVWSFKALYGSAAAPIYGSLVLDASGNLYGVTNGGAFKLSPPTGGETAWTETDIASFGNYYAQTGMVFDNSGNLFGVHRYQPGASGVGDVFELTPPAKGTRWALSFVARLSSSGGSDARGTPALDSAGNIYGTASDGAHGNKGSVFEVAPDGTLSVLHKFDSMRDGASPIGSVVLDAAGNIYGTSSTGGPNGNGAVWEILAH